jgi:hypothetical protein
MTLTFDHFFELMSEPANEEPVPEITPEGIRRQQCACCGLPATMSFHDLKRRRRILLCDACRPPIRS